MSRSISTLRDDVRRGKVKASQVLETTLSALEQAQGLNAITAIDREQAFAAAATVDAAVAEGRDPGRLAGVPVVVKDNICVRGQPVTCGSRILGDYHAPYDAHVVELLRREGALLFARANMDEFAMGSSSETSCYGAVRNPWDAERVPGGSSGGSAAIVGCGAVPAALGSDTGGSVRQPGAFCGVTALKPTYGRVSRYGLVAFASSLDQIGPMTRTSDDAAAVFAALAGHDVRDATCLDAGPFEPVPAPKGLKVGLLRLDEASQPSAAVGEAFEAAAGRLEAMGHQVVPVELPSASLSIAVYYVVAPAEASSNLARFDGMRYGARVDGENLFETYCRTRAEGFGPEVKRRIMLGTYALSSGYYDAYYLRAQQVRTLICREFKAAFEKCDVMLAPTAPTTAFKLGEVTDPLAMYAADIYTLPPSLAGLPALNVPVGRDDAGLPIGMQLVGPALSEPRLLSLGQALYDASDVDSWVGKGAAGED